MNNDQDKSFEKKLNSLSADFELTPAADSWNKIEAQLPVKKKRRFIFFLIPIGIVMLMACVFVFSNDDLMSGSGSSSSSSSDSDSQRNTVELATKTKINNSDISNHSSENKDESAIASTGNSFSSTGISMENNQIKKQKSNTYNSTSNDLTKVKNNEQSIVESPVVTNDNEVSNEQLIKMTLINPTLMTNNNQSPVWINFQQIQQPKKPSRWSVGFTYLPMFTNRKVSYDLQNSNPSFIDDTSNKRTDENLFTNNFGLDLYYSISKFFYLHTGIYSITHGEKSFYDNKVYQNTVVGIPFTALNYADYITPGSEQKHTNKYSFIQMPFSIGINIRTGKKTALNIEPGFAYGYLVKSNALQFVTINDSLRLNALDNSHLHSMNRNAFFADASVSFNWFIIKNISWRTGLKTQYQLTDLYKKQEIQSQHNYGFGLQTSLIFHFK